MLSPLVKAGVRKKRHTTKTESDTARSLTQKARLNSGTRNFLSQLPSMVFNVFRNVRTHLPPYSSSSSFEAAIAAISSGVGSRCI